MQLIRIDGMEKVFNEFAEAIRATFKANSEKYGPALFYTDAQLLYPSFIGGLPQHKDMHNCRACASFIERYGRLVFITATGQLVPALWDANNVPEFYQFTVEVLANSLKTANVTGQAFAANKIIGTQEDGGYPHLWIQIDERYVNDVPEVTTQIKEEHFEGLRRGLKEFNQTTVKQVLLLIAEEKLPNAHLIEHTAKWVDGIYKDLGTASPPPNSNRRDNVLRRYAAGATAGMNFFRGKLLGSLMKDLASGISTKKAIRNYNENAKAENHLRPKAPPTAGNVRHAERVFEELDLASALARRHAAWGESPLIWESPSTKTKARGGLFDHLRTKDEEPVPKCSTEPSTFTWVKFLEKVLPNAKRVYFKTRYENDHYGAFVTAVNPNAEPLFKWDMPDHRNPVSAYAHVHGSKPDTWGLRPDMFVEVLGIADQPWANSPVNFGAYTGNLLVLKNARDKDGGGLAIFPGDLRPELHAVRATIEAFSNNGHMAEAPEGQLLSGLLITKGHTGNARLRVVTDLGVSDYIIDRWD